MMYLMQKQDKVPQCLHERYAEGKKQKWILVEGDTKVYELLQSVRYEYGEYLSWRIPYWLRYTTAAIQSCLQFKCMYHFILEPWELMSRINRRHN